MSPHHAFLVFVGMCIAVVVIYVKLRESASEVGKNIFEITSIETGQGVRCELVDCSHNVGVQLVSKSLRLGGKDTASVDKIELYQGACSIDSHGFPSWR